MAEEQTDIYYYLPLFLHYYGIAIKDSLQLPRDHFLALAKGIEVIEARKTHGLVTAISMVLNGNNEQFESLEALAFDLDSNITLDLDEDETIKRWDDFIGKMTRAYRGLRG